MQIKKWMPNSSLFVNSKGFITLLSARVTTRFVRLGSQHFVCISLVQDRRNVAIAATETGVLATPVTSIASMANESNRFCRVATKAARPQGHRFANKGSEVVGYSANFGFGG